MPEQLLPLVTYCALMAGTPGPNNVMLATSGANFGYRRTLPHLLGINAGLLVMTFVVCVGLGAVFERHPQIHDALRVAGSLYLVYLAWKLAGPTVSADPGAARPLTFVEGALFQAVNPKSWVRAATIASVFMPPGMPALQGALLVSLVSSAVGFPFISVWTLFGVSIRRFLGSPRRLRAFNVVMGVSLLALALNLLMAGAARAGEVTVAVAANFAAPMQKLALEFEAASGHKARLAVGSSGAFYTQVRNGAPFEMLLSADDETPARLEKEGFAVAGSRFTYATGRLVLWSARPGAVDAAGEVLKRGNVERIAIANPKFAPYGQAAIETMQRLGVLEALQPKIVQGENIAQAFQFVATGNAPLGFVALSQVVGRHPGWVVPESLHTPLRQDAILLRAGKDNPAAAELMNFLKGDKARGIIRAYGYQT